MKLRVVWVGNVNLDTVGQRERKNCFIAPADVDYPTVAGRVGFFMYYPSTSRLNRSKDLIEGHGFCTEFDTERRAGDLNPIACETILVFKTSSTTWWLPSARPK